MPSLNKQHIRANFGLHLNTENKDSRRLAAQQTRRGRSEHGNMPTETQRFIWCLIAALSDSLVSTNNVVPTVAMCIPMWRTLKQNKVRHIIKCSPTTCRNASEKGI